MTTNLEDATLFCEVYCKFLSKITDDMYLELTYQDTLKILKSMLISAIVNFKFPKMNIRDYSLSSLSDVNCTQSAFDEIEERTLSDDFTDYCDCGSVLTVSDNLEELDHWPTKLGVDEIEILAMLMKLDWLSQQLDSKEMLKMKPLSSDFEMPSQANHIAKLTDWFKVSVTQLNSLQNLYSRREVDNKGNVSSTFKRLGGRRNDRKKQIRL